MISLSEAGELPSRPDTIRSPRAWRNWYDRHARCANSPCYMPREVGKHTCVLCSKLVKMGPRALREQEPAAKKRRKPRRI